MDIRMFMDLPVDLVGEILQDWLELRSLVRVDSAVCSHSARPALLKLFASKNGAQKRTVTLRSVSCSQWFIKRKVQLKRVALCEPASQEISKCLRLNSKSIWCAHCSSDDETIDLVAMNCRNLTYFWCENLTARPHLNATLGFNESLQELRLENVKELSLSHFENVLLLNLKAISLQGSVCDDALLSAIVCTTEALQYLDIGMCVNITDEGVIAMAKRCPLLLSLDLQELQITDNAIEESTKLCPRIDSLGVRGNALLTDSGVLSVAKNLTQLRAINLSECGKVTDLSMEHLALYCKSTLETLYVHDLQQVRVDVLIGLLQQCRQLCTLVLDCDIEPYCADIVPHMRNLKSLLLYCVLSDKCVCLIAQHCQKLQKLGIPCTFKVQSDLAAAAHQSAVEAGVEDVRVMRCVDDNTNENDVTYTEDGILAMMDGLSNLQRLWAPAVTGRNQNSTHAHIAVQRLWQRLRPGLQFKEDHHCFYQDIVLPQS